MFPDSFLYKQAAFTLFHIHCLAIFFPPGTNHVPQPPSDQASWAHHFPRDGRRSPPTDTRICPAWRFGEEIFCSVSGWWHAPSGHNAPRHGFRASYGKVREAEGDSPQNGCMFRSRKKKQRPKTAKTTSFSQGWKPTEKKNKKKEWMYLEIPYMTSPIPPPKNKKKDAHNRKSWWSFAGNPWCHPLFFFLGGVQKGLRLTAMCELKSVKTVQEWFEYHKII